MNIFNIYEDIRAILQKIKNKNSFYRKIGLNITYLNLKNFILNKEPLKEKSKKYLYGYLGYQEISLIVNPDELTKEEIKVIEKINSRFLQALEYFIETEFKNDRKKFSYKDLTNEDIQQVQDIMKNLNVFIEEGSKFDISEDSSDEETEKAKTNESNKSSSDIQINI